ncbi:TrkA family potassium uptake protein [Halodesulfurarchaeum sp. HSR-GB]|uniref:potassium channel family protein n=1 Tax=Halodesulfurarchaeum sp. HSR-GB TaxID=3074077 RepID=UPI0028651B23|nr:TrkA family potassium uptake protein [Halodesulfurarchaeum sp. HSR-GB]MDR5655819.1 TrkA family potassium uptake protein [Halodesulfurarchaeum sp. HSR-GB]
MYLIIVGAGDIGTPLIDIATAAENEVVVIERDEARADFIASEYDCLVLNADATNIDTFADAGAAKADAIISTAEHDATNVMTSLLAKEFGIPHVLSVMHNTDHRELFRRIGVQTMENPEDLIADHLYRAVERPAIKDFLRIGEDAEVFEITVTEDAELAGMSIGEAAEQSRIPEDVLFVAIDRDDCDRPITPGGDTVLQAGDLVTVYSGFGASPELTDLFGHYEDHL